MKNFSKIWTAALTVALSLAACEKPDEKPTDSSGVPVNDLQAGEVQIRVQTQDKKVSFYATAVAINISWGDGSTEAFVPNDGAIIADPVAAGGAANIKATATSPREGTVEHTYAADGIVNIKLQATDLVAIRLNRGKNWRFVFGACDLELFDTYYSGDRCSYLDFSKCAKLATLNKDRYGSRYLAVDSLNIANCTALAEVEAHAAVWVNASGCTALKKLEMNSNSYGGSFDTSVYYLNVSGCSALEELGCSYRRLTSIDVSSCTALKKLDCGGGGYYEGLLTSLDVSKNTELTSLDCGSNQLTSLDVSKNAKLTYLDCSENQLSASALNAIFRALPTLPANGNSEQHNYGMYGISGNPGTADCDESIAKSKNWKSNLVSPINEGE